MTRLREAAARAAAFLESVSDDAGLYCPRSVYADEAKALRTALDTIPPSVEAHLDSPSVTSRQGEEADKACPECGGSGETPSGTPGMDDCFEPCPRGCSAEGE